MTQETESLITDEMRASIGREGPPVRHEVDKTGIRMFARAVGHIDLIFFDEEHAKSKGHRSIVAPPGYLGATVARPGSPAGPVAAMGMGAGAGPGAGGAGRGGGSGGGRRPGRVLNGGNDYEYTGIDICAGDVLTGVSKTVSIDEAASGSLGAKMLITRRETVYTNQNGEVVCRAYGTSLQY